MTARLTPAARPEGRRGLPLVFAVFFYACLALAVWNLPRVARDGGLLASVLAVCGSLYAAAVVMPGLAATASRRGYRSFDRRMRANRTAVAGLVVVLAFACAAIMAPLLTPADPLAQDDPSATRYEAPSADHPLGTDRFGRDMLARVLYGARASLGIAITAVLLAMVFGTAYGALAGFAGGRLDDAMMRLVDGLLAFPRLVFVLTLVALIPASVGVLVLVIAATGWMGIARLVRGEVARLRGREYVTAAVATGVGGARLAARHLLPNAMGPVIVAATLNVGAVILLESYLSFLGLGIRPPAPSWGAMVFEGREVLLEAWWVSGVPAIAITAAVLALNLLGDGLRDALETRSGA